jgi:hypothetical protein
MRVLFDNGTPRGVATALSGHTVEEVACMVGTRSETASCSMLRKPPDLGQSNRNPVLCARETRRVIGSVLAAFLAIIGIDNACALAQAPRGEISGAYTFVSGSAVSANGWQIDGALGVSRRVALVASVDESFGRESFEYVLLQSPGSAAADRYAIIIDQRVRSIVGGTRGYISTGPRVAVFGEAMVGRAHASANARASAGMRQASLQETFSTAATWLDMRVGGGVEIGLHSRLRARAALDYAALFGTEYSAQRRALTPFGDRRQNNRLRFAAGLAWALVR